MTVATTANKITYDGNASDTVFPYTFANPSVDDIVVYYTDADGVITDVTADATVVVNAAIPPNPTPVGGMVTYPTSGSPIALGTLLTIYRSLSEVQDTSLSGQGILYQKVIEQQLDYLTMTVQQVQELFGRGIVVAISDDTPLPLPPAAQRASMLMGFDADGNPIAVELTDAGTVTVSSVMIPVVEAATLALSRAAYGLGNIAIEDIGAGLEDDGSGNVRFISTPVLDSTGQAVVAAFHMTERHASLAITYTNPAVSTLFDGFGYYVYAQTAAVTFAIDAGDAFSGMSNGVSLIIPAGTQVYISTDGVNTWFARQVQAIGYDSPLNLQINASVAGNALTVAIKDRNGNDPSKTTPVLVAFRDPTATNGNPAIRAVTGALSVVAPNGASFGTISGVACRLWLVAFDNAGTVVLGLFQSVTAASAAAVTLISPLNEAALNTGTAIGAGSTSAGTFYTNGAITTKAMRILGYVDFDAGQATAGTWATAPSRIQLFGPGIKKPGEVVQPKRTVTGAVNTGTTALPNDDTIPAMDEGDEFMNLALTVTAPCNVIDASARMFLSNSGGTATIIEAMLGITTGATPSLTAGQTAMGGSGAVPLDLDAAIIANAATTTFRARGGAAAGITTFNGLAAARKYGGAMNSFIDLKEIMV